MNDLATVPIHDAALCTSTYDEAFWTRRPFGVDQESGLSLYWDGDSPTQISVCSSRRFNLVVKRVMDVVLSGLALVALAPLLVIVAIAIKCTSEGPVFFCQKREGLNGKDFLVFKFRSFAKNACDPTGVAQTLTNDVRVTAVGRFIRKTSIDELPQLLNVLRGDMSLVGPRPHVSGMIAGGMDYRELVTYYDRRLDVLPGLTGWAQCNGLRGPTDAASVAVARVNHDIAYVQNFNVLLDVKIILLTIKNQFLGGSGS